MRSRDEIDIHDDDLTTAEAAELAQVDRATVRQWKARGHLSPASYDRRGRPLYRALDVAKAERATREKARRS